MKITEELFDKIAHLARLEFSEEEKSAMMKDMSKIVSWVEKLEELDTEGVEPLTGMSHEMNALRKDEKAEHLDKELAMQNAPEKENGFFKVPKVING